MDRVAPTISLCMIVKDEASFIAQALASVREIVRQMVVVDTGSCDATPQIAREHGAEVFEFAWGGDFAGARNFSLSKAICDWILVLDADEAIAAAQLPVLSRLTHQQDCCYELYQRHYSNDHRLSDYHMVRGEFPEWEREYRGFFESKLVRLFPNHRGIQYIGRIHELVEPCLASLADLRIVTSEIRLHHYGHTPEVSAKKNKNPLYKTLGTTKATETPQDWKVYFELGIECNRPGQREESVCAFKKSLELNSTYLPTWINLGYVLCELNRTTEAVECLSKALALDPHSAEARCNLGVAYLRQNQATVAEQLFREAIKLKPSYLNAYFNLSRSLAMQKRVPEAILIAERAVDLCPTSPAAQADLGTLYVLGGAIEIGRSLLSSALQADPSLEEVRAILSSL
jgi:tetratricopeptide (TPR) repeat protein